MSSIDGMWNRPGPPADEPPVLLLRMLEEHLQKLVLQAVQEHEARYHGARCLPANRRQRPQ